MYFSVEVYRKDTETYIASCPELDVHSYGQTTESAIERLKRIVNFYLESAEEMGMTLEELGLQNSAEKEIVQRVSSVNTTAPLN